MRRISAVCVALGLASTACDHATAPGQEMATLQVGVQGLYENTGEIDLKAGKYTVKADATSLDASLNVNVLVLTADQAPLVVADMQFVIPNVNPKIPAGQTASTSQLATLSPGLTTTVALLLTFGAAGGQTPDSAMNIAINVNQDKPAPTVIRFQMYPGPTVEAFKPFSVRVQAKNNNSSETNADLIVQALVTGGQPVTLQYDNKWDEFVGNVTAPKAGAYKLEISVADKRKATTIDSKDIWSK